MVSTVTCVPKIDNEVIHFFWPFPSRELDIDWNIACSSHEEARWNSVGLVCLWLDAFRQSTLSRPAVYFTWIEERFQARLLLHRALKRLKAHSFLQAYAQYFAVLHQ